MELPFIAARSLRPLRTASGAGLLIFASTVSAQLPVAVYPQGQGASIGSSGDNYLEVEQFEDRAIMDWTSFSIGEGNSVHFNQQSHQAILNRIIGTESSEILGNLTAGGTVWLINPNGVLIGEGARVETQSFVASTLDVSDQQFLGGDLFLDLAGDSQASVVNHGTIKALGGSVALVARQVDNRGLLQASKGSVMLGAGNDVELTLTHARYSQGIRVRSTLRPVEGTGVNHEGIIEAAQAELAAAGGNIYSLAVNVSGRIQAHGRVFDDDQQYYPGGIYLMSKGGKMTVASGAELMAQSGNIVIGGGSSGSIDIAGKLDATSSGDTRGSIHVSGGSVQLADGAELDVSGSNSAGLIEIRSADQVPSREIVVNQGAVLRAEGAEGRIHLEGEALTLEGNFVGTAGTLELNGTAIDGVNGSFNLDTVWINGELDPNFPDGNQQPEESEDPEQEPPILLPDQPTQQEQQSLIEIQREQALVQQQLTRTEPTGVVQPPEPPPGSGWDDGATEDMTRFGRRLIRDLKKGDLSVEDIADLVQSELQGDWGLNEENIDQFIAALLESLQESTGELTDERVAEIIAEANRRIGAGETDSPQIDSDGSPDLDEDYARRTEMARRERMQQEQRRRQQEQEGTAAEQRENLSLVLDKLQQRNGGQGQQNQQSAGSGQAGSDLQKLIKQKLASAPPGLSRQELQAWLRQELLASGVTPPGSGSGSDGTWLRSGISGPVNTGGL